MEFLITKGMRSRLYSLMVCLLAAGMLSGQVTPPNADSDAECGEDCYDIFSWGSVDDASGTAIPNIGEGVAEDANCNTIIDGGIEYEGNDINADVIGTFFGANQQGTSPWTDTWTVTFGDALTDPIFNVGGLFSDSKVTFADCDGNPITITDISSGTVIASGMFDGNDEVQLDGSFDCVIVTVSNDRNDQYSISVGTCLGANPPPPCSDCGTDESFKYISLSGYSAADNIADVNLDGVKIGDASVIENTLTISEDLSGNAFGAFANGRTDAETLLMRIDLCEPISVQQVDVLGLETESQVWVGTSLDGSSNPTGLALTSCGGTRATMAVDASNSSMVTNVSSSCANQGNGKYTVGGATVSTLYFRYTNPAGGCSFDKATFRIASCVADPAEPAVPECPLTLVTVTTDPDVADGTTMATNGNSDTYLRDANGNYFNRSTCFPLDADGLPNIPATPIAIAKISPCAEVIEEETCGGCTPPPPCTECPADNSYKYVSLQNATSREAGGIGDISLDGVIVGDFEIVSSDLDVSVDVRGTQFGGWDNNGGTLELKLNFCEPISAQQLDIRNLESQSKVTLTGATIAQCDGPITMAVTGGNVVESLFSGSCSPNPNGSYTFLSGNPISTLTFKYENPEFPKGERDCRGDYVGFRIGVCVPPVLVVTPECPLEVKEEVVILADGTVNTTLVVKDANGKYFAYSAINATAADELVEVIEYVKSPCAVINNVCGVGTEDKRDTKGLCGICFVPPVIATVECSVPEPVVTRPFDVNITGLENMKAVDNNEKDFGLLVFLYPPTYTAADVQANYPPAPGTFYTIAQADGMAKEDVDKPILLGVPTLNADCTAATLSNIVLPSTFPQIPFKKGVVLDCAPTLDPTSKPVNLSDMASEVIPTMGQWALFILGLMIASLAVVRIRQTKNHEVKELA